MEKRNGKEKLNNNCLKLGDKEKQLMYNSNKDIGLIDFVLDGGCSNVVAILVIVFLISAVAGFFVGLRL